MRNSSVFIVLLTAAASAQNPVLHPTSNVTIGSGSLAYSSIHIPAGVMVTFTGVAPVQIQCDGDAVIDGVMSVSDGAFVTGNPGMVSTGAGAFGGEQQLTFQGPFVTTSFATSGVHAGFYGSAVPFSLAGGSPGGGFISINWVGQAIGIEYGGNGGGTIALEVGGDLSIGGWIKADAQPPTGGNAGGGSGGSVLLRAMGDLTIAPGGQVTARGSYGGGPGIIRIDTYDQSPQILGQVAPAPKLKRLPDLVEASPPQLATFWQLDVTAPRGDSVFLSASFQPGSGTTPYGQLGINLATAIPFAVLTVPAAGVDPMTGYALFIPNDPQLTGLQLWVQGLNWFTAQPPRYTQTVLSIVP